MSVDQLPAEVREFANYLDGLLARLDEGGGWCGVFWQRDPEGMQACLDGREVPPWDVVQALLQDLAAEYGPAAATEEKERARPLHAAALTAHDHRPGGRDALGDRLDVMLREQKYAAERLTELGQLLSTATTRQAADTLRLDLAWARDDHTRATARCAELRTRIANLDQRASADLAPNTRPTPPTGPVSGVGAGARNTTTGAAAPIAGEPHRGPNAARPAPGQPSPQSAASAPAAGQPHPASAASASAAGWPHPTSPASHQGPTGFASQAGSGAVHAVAGHPQSGVPHPASGAPHSSVGVPGLWPTGSASQPGSGAVHAVAGEGHPQSGVPHPASGAPHSSPGEPYPPTGTGISCTRCAWPDRPPDRLRRSPTGV
jgi:hypothetical protein